MRRKSCIVCKWKVFLLNGSTCVSRGYQLLWRCICTVCKRKAFVRFEVFANFEGEIILNTWVEFVFSLQFHVRLGSKVQCILLDQSGYKVGDNWRQHVRDYFQQFWKSESNWNTPENDQSWVREDSIGITLSLLSSSPDLFYSCRPGGSLFCYLVGCSLFEVQTSTDSVQPFPTFPFWTYFCCSFLKAMDGYPPTG